MLRINSDSFPEDILLRVIVTEYACGKAGSECYVKCRLISVLKLLLSFHKSRNMDSKINNCVINAMKHIYSLTADSRSAGQEIPT